MRSSSILLNSILSSTLGFGILWITLSTAYAGPILMQRCSLDNLTPSQAESRLEWARKCATTLHTDGTSDTLPAGEFSIDGPELQEYLDDRYSNKNYTALPDYYINTTYRQNLFSLGGTMQSTDPLGFFKWTKATKRTRPFYPTFGDDPNINIAQQLKPKSDLSDCNLYNSNNQISAKFYVNGFCESSCYTPEQEVLFPHGYQRIDQAVAALRPTMMTLTPESTLGDISLMSNDVQSYTVEIRDATHVIFEINTASGGQLRITDQHPVVLGNGRLVQAHTLNVGQALIREDGSMDLIVSIEKEKFYGKVYNIRPQTTDRRSNLLIAQGYLVGSSRYQNDDVGYINRMILGRAIPDEMLPPNDMTPSTIPIPTHSALSR